MRPGLRVRKTCPERALIVAHTMGAVRANYIREFCLLSDFLAIGGLGELDCDAVHILCEAHEGGTQFDVPSMFFDVFTEDLFMLPLAETSTRSLYFIRT